jgi:hypothetical protein
MEQSPSWEAERFSASQEIPRILWDSKVHYRIYKSPPPVQLNAVHAPIPLLEDLFEYYPPIYVWVSQVVFFPQVSLPKSCMHLHRVVVMRINYCAFLFRDGLKIQFSAPFPAPQCY